MLLDQAEGYTEFGHVAFLYHEENGIGGKL